MGSRVQPTGSCMLRCIELCRSYISHAKRVYRRPDGTPTRTWRNIELALRPLMTEYADVSAYRFHSSHLRAIRGSWVRDGLTRTTINDRTRVIVAMFVWAAELGMVSDDVVAHLRVVRPLRRGMAAEGAGVDPVSTDIIMATLPHMPAAIADMCRFMLLTGARVGETREARSDELHIVEQPSLQLWVLRPRWHKTARHGCRRSLVLNRKAQRLLTPRLGRAYMFGPKDGGQPYHPAAVTVARIEAPVRTVAIHIPGTNTLLVDGVWVPNDTLPSGSGSVSSSGASSSKSSGSSFSSSASSSAASSSGKSSASGSGTTANGSISFSGTTVLL